MIGESAVFYIVAAGEVCDGDLPVQLREGDFLCAADAGYLRLMAAGQKPDLLIGDFDSMEEPKDVDRITLPVIKDDTDTVYAVKEGLKRGFRRFRIYGALGGARISHTVANIQLLSMIRDMGGEGELLKGKTAISLLGAGDHRSFDSGRRGLISLFSLTEASDVTIRGLFYPLDHGELRRIFPLGVSNHFTGEEAEILVHRGEVLLILEEE